MSNKFLNKYKVVVTILIISVLLFVLRCTLSGIGGNEMPKIVLTKSVKDSIKREVRLRYSADSLESSESYNVEGIELKESKKGN